VAYGVTEEEALAQKSPGMLYVGSSVIRYADGKIWRARFYIENGKQRVELTEWEWQPIEEEDGDG
jgi:hypothetical protein